MAYKNLTKRSLYPEKNATPSPHFSFLILDMAFKILQHQFRHHSH